MILCCWIPLKYGLPRTGSFRHPASVAAHRSLVPGVPAPSPSKMLQPLVCPKRDWTVALTAKISLIGTQKALEDVKSPLPWVSEKGLEHGAFARWATDTGKCFMVPQDGETISKEDCATSFTGFVFKALAPVEEVKAFPSKPQGPPPPAPPSAPVPSGPRPHLMQPNHVPPPATATAAIVQGQQKFQIQLMYHPEYCLSADGESILMEKCDESESQSFTLQRVSACDGHGTAYQLQVGGKCVTDDGTLKLSDCSHSPAWVKLLPMINEKDLVMNITLKLQDNPAASFGETYMGNPGVHLPWDVNRLSMGSRSLCDAQADVFGSCASVLQAISQGPGGTMPGPGQRCHPAWGWAAVQRLVYGHRCQSLFLRHHVVSRVSQRLRL